MRFNRLLLIACLGAGLCLPACKKGADDNGPLTAAPFFFPGHGVRALQTVTSGNNGTLRGYLTADLSLSTPNTLRWCFGQTSPTGANRVWRRTINIATGDTLPETGTLRGIAVESLNGGNIRYVPYTNRLYSLVQSAAGTTVDGEVQLRNASDNLDHLHSYANGDILSASLSSYYQNGPIKNATLSSSIIRAGSATAVVQRITHVVSQENKQYRVAGFELGPDGNTVALAIDAESVVALRLSDGARLAEIPFTAYSQPAAITGPTYRGVRSKRSQDGSHMSCLFMTHSTAGEVPTVTTLRYDFATRQITVVVPGVKPAGFQLSFIPQVDIDDEGAFYFPQNVDAAVGKGLKIIKQTGSAQQVLATGFVADDQSVGLGFLKVISGKVFLALSGQGSSPGQTTNSSAHVLGVIE